MANKKRGTFLVSGELIKEALALPDGTVIVAIQVESLYSYQFRFLVSHDDLPEVSEGVRATELTPKFTTDYDKKPDTWLSFDWGIGA